MRIRILFVVCAVAVLFPCSASAQLRAVAYVTGLSSPVAFVQDPGDATIQYVVQQGGRIRVIRNGTLQTTDFLTLTSSIQSGGERGLLGLAFAPDYVISGRFFVNFTAVTTGHTVIARFLRSAADPLVADPASRFDLLWSTGERLIRQPFANHNGGTIAFGPDGFLYIGMGDGGSGNDPSHNAQNPDSLLGKMLRIDVSVPDSNTAGFVVPADNPFRTGSRPEIWSVGLRNPWKWSFDDPSRGGTGALVIADVGQGAFEEIDYEPAGRGGRNYGWRNREGAHDTNISPNLPPAFLPLVDPIHEYGRSSGASVTGGYVYRGSGLSSTYRGRYFLGDFISGRIWSIALTINPSTGDATASDLQEHTSELSSSGVSSFGVDASGELYFVNYNSGRVLRIEAAGPTMTVDTATLTFGAVTTGAAFSSQTSTQAVRLTQTGTGTVTWTASSSASWLVVSPTSGSGSGTLSVSVQFASGLAATQSGTVTLAFTGAGSTPAPIQITLNTTTTTASAPPTGAFDTPADGSTGLTGSIAVTGWATDNVEVTRVRILRDPVAGEPAGVLVFLGDAVLVEGARPDVQAAFPTVPRASRAGWGYLLLTNFLPGLGNGTFRLTAIADDADGQSTTLGTKTITCANSAATAPFGAIDTPDQGATVSGTVTNFGWVLSPGSRRADPPGGGTVQLVIDGAFSSAGPAGWTNRADLSALFPVAQFSGINTALGVAAFDSTALTNGVHTISWLVTDNQGSASGIGSRYFTVSNGSGLTWEPSFRLTAFAEASAVKKAEATGLEEKEPAGGVPGKAAWLPPLGGRLFGRRGFDPRTPYRLYEPDADGRVTIQAEELDRIELVLEGGEGGRRVEGARRLEGALRVGDRLAPLPIGSRVDSETGTFTWNPGVGFYGTYDLVLGGRDVRVVLSAQRTNRVGPQVIVDIANGGIVAGWAVDLDAAVDTGVVAVHVWAYPAAGGAPIFVGAAEYGGARPDVAAIHGARFLKSGYGLAVRGLAPGTYDLAVFPYSTITRAFGTARVVRVVIR